MSVSHWHLTGISLALADWQCTEPDDTTTCGPISFRILHSVNCEHLTGIDHGFDVRELLILLPDRICPLHTTLRGTVRLSYIFRA
jgi:hypothetical protein